MAKKAKGRGGFFSRFKETFVGLILLGIVGGILSQFGGDIYKALSDWSGLKRDPGAKIWLKAPGPQKSDTLVHDGNRN